MSKSLMGEGGSRKLQGILDKTLRTPIYIYIYIYMCIYIYICIMSTCSIVYLGYTMYTQSAHYLWKSFMRWTLAAGRRRRRAPSAPGRWAGGLQEAGVGGRSLRSGLMYEELTEHIA